MGPHVRKEDTPLRRRSRRICWSKQFQKFLFLVLCKSFRKWYRYDYVGEGETEIWFLKVCMSRDEGLLMELVKTSGCGLQEEIEE